MMAQSLSSPDSLDSDDLDCYEIPAKMMKLISRECHITSRKTLDEDNKDLMLLHTAQKDTQSY